MKYVQGGLFIVGLAVASYFSLGAPKRFISRANVRSFGVTAAHAGSVTPAAEATSVTTGTLQSTHASIGLKQGVSQGVDPNADGSCPAGMAFVEGEYCPTLEQKCLRWLDPETKLRCAEFAPTGSCQGKTVHRRFCIDQYEYPNKAGEKPVVMKTWYEARDTCNALGKRLCGDTEWTVACEGEEHLPYPYGYARNSDACNIDKPHPAPDEKALGAADPAIRDAEVARLDQRDPSGFREACVSPYGVHDMAGNVDEWVVNESKAPFASGLKGGYWGPVRTRCRPMTTAHSEGFQFYQIGFRCCADASEPKTASKDATSAPASRSVSGESNASSGQLAKARVNLTGI
jgi:sulfatase modifying factor 1